MRFNEQIIANSPVGISLYNATSGDRIAGNTSMAKLVGASRDQVLGQNYLTITS